MTPSIELENIVFRYPGASREALVVPKFVVEKGVKLFLYGPSGSGKTTLLNIIGGVLCPSSGRAGILDEVNFSDLPPNRRDRFRADHVGFIFQMFNLLPFLSVTENVLLPLNFSPTRKAKVAKGLGEVGEANRLLKRLGLGVEDNSQRVVSDLSIGQQQRVAVARALIGAPEIIVADEPTSALDSEVTSSFIEMLMEECSVAGITLIFVSHNLSLRENFDSVIDMNELNLAGGKGR